MNSGANARSGGRPDFRVFDLPHPLVEAALAATLLKAARECCSHVQIDHLAVAAFGEMRPPAYAVEIVFRALVARPPGGGGRGDVAVLIESHLCAALAEAAGDGMEVGIECAWLGANREKVACAACFVVRDVRDVRPAAPPSTAAPSLARS